MESAPQNLVAPTTSSSVVDEEDLPRNSAPLILLVVDDDPTTRQVCQDVAILCGMKVLSAASAEEALEVIDAASIDILLTDLQLPLSSGLDLLKLVHESHPDIAVVVLTQYGTI